jgi:hypothetical protein
MVVMSHEVKQEVEVELNVDLQSALVDGLNQLRQFWLETRDQVLVTDDCIQSISGLESYYLLVSC